MAKYARSNPCPTGRCASRKGVYGVTDAAGGRCCCSGSGSGKCCLRTQCYHLCMGGDLLFPCYRGSRFRGSVSIKEDFEYVCCSEIPPNGGLSTGECRTKHVGHYNYSSVYERFSDLSQECTPAGCSTLGQAVCITARLDWDEFVYHYRDDFTEVFHNTHTVGCQVADPSEDFALGTFDPFEIFTNFIHLSYGCAGADFGSDTDPKHKCSGSFGLYVFDPDVGLVFVTTLTWTIINSCNYIKIVIDHPQWNRVIDGREHSGVYHFEYEWVGTVLEDPACQCPADCGALTGPSSLPIGSGIQGGTTRRAGGFF